MAQSQEPPNKTMPLDTGFYLRVFNKNPIIFFFFFSSFFTTHLQYNNMSTNITWHEGSVPLAERQTLLNQKVRHTHPCEFRCEKLTGIIKGIHSLVHRSFCFR